MKAEIIRIGNSQGVRIPKPVLEQCSLKGQVEMNVEGDKLVIQSVRSVREGWDEAFQSMAEAGDDVPLMEDAKASDWDESEWQW